MTKKTICLNMIVKDEASVITRCLDSLRHLIDYWVIVDTGSTDGTQQLIRDYFKDVPGELHERPWVDFATNRSEALALARSKADYNLIIDADDTLEIPEGFTLPDLTADAYSFEIRDQQLHYPRNQLVSNRLDWRYRGVLHEYIFADQPHKAESLAIGMRRGHDGARRKDSNRFKRDAVILQKALNNETDQGLLSRYVFYLAQSYRDAGEFELSLYWYLMRSKLGYWVEEVYYSLLQVARLKEQLNYPAQDILKTYERASRVHPDRSEAAYGASRLCRILGHFQEGMRIAQTELDKVFPPASLFGSPFVYEFGLLEEYAICASNLARYEESRGAYLRLLSRPNIPTQKHVEFTAGLQQLDHKLGLMA